MPARSASVGLLELLLPAACAGCGRYGATLCRFVPHRPAGAGCGRTIGSWRLIRAWSSATPWSWRWRPSRTTGRCVARWPASSTAARPGRRPAGGQRRTPHGRRGCRGRHGVLVPVPVHRNGCASAATTRRRLLAGALGAPSRLPVADILERRRATARQHGSTAPPGCTTCAARSRCAPGARAPPVVILVDDILTTSATLESCAAVLRDAGAERVLGFAVAREV